MSAKKYELIRIAVTNGDAKENNRLAGKSNTGTYFICSVKDFDVYHSFFQKDKSYYLDIKKVLSYKILFIECFFEFRALYPDGMRFFRDICDSLVRYNNNQEVFITIRQNDARVFMKFEDNNREVEYALRNILYSKLSNIVIENHNDYYLIYPEINYDCLS